MFNNELKDLLVKVVTSWQVIVVTLVILIYMALVNHVSRSRYRRRNPTVVKPGKIKQEKAAPEEEIDDSALGLED